ncbi:MAG: response regulator, partial [Bacteroidota bacterium]
PEEKFNTLFESFTQVDASTTRKYGGTGLGLAISYNLSRLMGGDMWVESKPGEGAEFFFTIKSGLSAPWKVKGKDHPATELQGKTVAIAIQDPEALSILQVYMHHWGLKTKSFGSLETMLDALLDGENIDFYLLDTRFFRSHSQKAANQFAEVCKEKGKHYGLLSEPELAIALHDSVNEFGWILPKPLKRDELLHALLLQRIAFRSPEMESARKKEQLAENVPLRILIAEDNPINMDVAQSMLHNLGYEPDGAENGRVVLDKLKSQKFDLIFMDVQMPEMDGLETTRRIIKKYQRPQRPMIVAMTANAMESDRQRCLDAGMDTFISKPFLMDELVTLINEVGHAARSGQALPGAKNTTSAPVETPATVIESPTSSSPKTTPESSSQNNTANTTQSGSNGTAQPETAETPAAENGKVTDLGMLMEASGGDTMFVSGILQKLVAKLPEAITELRDARGEEDWETVRKTAHRTKSSAAYSGSLELKEMFRELEHMAREKEDLDQVDNKLDALESFVNKVIVELKDHLSELN